eukprot:c14949_g1_i2.p1 GENE.c14949_g1_i2~~c14949_g1_i2.p1  ORF type:complete len:673 (+),score=187.71 c14949_g1_i2:211-2019(+)
MVTGDAPLTALHVAREVTICLPNKKALLLKPHPDPDDAPSSSTAAVWVGAAEDVYGKLTIPFESQPIRTLAKEYNLMITEDALEATSAQLSTGDTVPTDRVGGKVDGRCWKELWGQLDHVHVFARMSPQGKAKIIRAMQQNSLHVLMCGDGGNDVGALKQADVGLALLAGYGNANTGDNTNSSTTTTNNNQAIDQPSGEVKAEDRLNQSTQALNDRAKEAMELRKKLVKQREKEIMAKRDTYIQEEMAARTRRGEDNGVMGSFAAAKVAMMRIKDELAQAHREVAQQHGNVYATAEEKESLLAQTDDALPIVRPGDASIAAPFTSRAPSIKSVVDLIRQGRCTMLSALQQQQIMMLDCLIYAFTLAALSLEGSRSSERQMIVSGQLLTIASLAFSYSSAVERMSPVRPIRSLFHPAVFISTVGQAAIHLGCLVYAVRMATEEMGPAAMKEIMEFNKAVKAGEDVSDQLDDSEDMLANFNMLWSKPFKPNLFNTVVFLVQTSQTIAVMLVNYKGRPWMKGLLENHVLALSLLSCIGGVAVCAWSVFPAFNTLIHLAPFPNDEFRWQVLYNRVSFLLCFAVCLWLVFSVVCAWNWYGNLDLSDC